MGERGVVLTVEVDLGNSNRFDPVLTSHIGDFGQATGRPWTGPGHA